MTESLDGPAPPVSRATGDGTRQAGRPAYDHVVLGDDALCLRPWRSGDAPVMAAACADPDIARFCMMPAGYTTAMARDFIADAPRAWADDGWLHLALTGGADDRLVGAVGLQTGRLDAPTADLGYWVMPDRRRRGLARDGVGLMIDWAFANLGLRRLAIGTMVGNDVSRRVAGGLGFRAEALLRSDRPLDGRRTDCVLYSLLDHEWRERAGGGEGRPAAAPPDETLLPALAAARADYPAATPALPAMPPLLGDGAIVLRPYRDGDVPDMVRACNDTETQRWLDVLPTPYTDADAREFMARAATAWQTRGDALLCIADAASDRLLGGVGLHGDELWAGVAEIGYHVAPWARRRGVATAAARLVAQWGLDVLGLGRVQILADTRNRASRGVAEKLGFTFEGARRSDHGRPGDLGNHAVYSLRPGDPRPW